MLCCTRHGLTLSNSSTVEYVYRSLVAVKAQHQSSFLVQRRHAACLVIRAAAAARPVFNRHFNRHGVHMHLSMSALDDYDDDVGGSGGGGRRRGGDDAYIIWFGEQHYWRSPELAAPKPLHWCNWCSSMRQRLRLMCSSSPLSVVAFRMSSSVD